MLKPPDYGVPTGVVPRLPNAQFVAALPEGFDEHTQLAVLPAGGVVAVHPDHAPRFYAAPIQQAVDNYLLMERKARAWDELRAFADRHGQIGLVAQMDSFVHPAHDPSTCK